MEPNVIVSLAAVAISLIALVLNSRKETRTDAARDAKLETKLDSISAGVEDIRVETRATRDKVDKLTERVVFVEASCASAHQRLDQLLGGRGKE